MAEFIASVSRDIPWHVTAFHPDYRMLDPAATTPAQLTAAAAIGARAGLRNVYAGNLPGRVGDLEHTRCASCGHVLIERYGYAIRSYRVSPDGRCTACAAAVPGRWDPAFGGQITSAPFQPADRTRLRMF